MSNCCSLRGGSDARIRQRGQEPLIADQATNREMVTIQAELDRLLPASFHEGIWQRPDLRGEWSVRDYLDLYYGHYRMLIDRINHALNNLA